MAEGTRQGSLTSSPFLRTRKLDLKIRFVPESRTPVRKKLMAISLQDQDVTTKMRKVSLSLMLLVLLVVGGVGVVASESATIISPAEGLTKFADGLTSQLYTHNNNDCTSSWGISMAFDLVYPGIGDANATADEICSVVGLCGGSSENNSRLLQWSQMESRMTSKYTGECSREVEDGEECWSGVLPTLKIANSVWIDDENRQNLEASYESTVGEFLRVIDFQSSDAGHQVNAWVDNKTEGLIENLIPDGPIGYQLVVVNSLYLNASWMFPFEEHHTTQDAFYVDQKTQIGAQFMHMVTDYFEYSDSLVPGFQILQLPYQASRISMIVALPLLPQAGEWDQAKDTEALRNLKFTELQPNLGSTFDYSGKVAVALPKFKFESTYEDDLKAALQALGLQAPFAEGFFAILQNQCLFIDKIIQKTLIDVNEKGTVAAAATMMGLDGGVPEPQQPILFLANRPFKFYIYDKEEGILLLEGMVGAPSTGQTDQPTSVASHAGEDFWTNELYADANPNKSS